jgi:hypothetical protein
MKYERFGLSPNLKAGKMPRFATTLIALIGSASLCFASLAFAESDEDFPPSVSEASDIPEPSSSMTDELSAPPTSATEVLSGTPDDSADAAASDSDLEDVPEMNSDASSENEQVLEIPQVVDRAEAAALNSGDNGSAQVSNVVGDDKSAQAPYESGDFNNYQSQNAEVSDVYRVPVPVFIPVPVGSGYRDGEMRAPVRLTHRIVGVGPISPLFRVGGFRPTPPIISRPGGLAGIPPSRMPTPPRGSVAIPRGWWTRTH